MTDFDARAATWDDDPAKVSRAATVAAAIAARVPDLARRQVLEYGCGTGLLGFAMRPRVAAVTLADSAPGMLEVLRRKIATSGLDRMTPLRLDLAVDPPPAGRFDLICSLMALHHVKDTAALLAAFRDLLAPGGMIALADLDAEDGSYHGAAEQDVHHGFDRAALSRLLEVGGFTAIHFETAVEMERPGIPRKFSVFLVTARLR